MTSPSPSIHILENQPFLKVVLSVLQSRLESGRPLRILEVGCGSARFTELLGRELGARAQILGIDPNEKVVSEAVERMGTLSVQNVELKVADLLHFDEGEKYDVLIFTKSLHHCLPLGEAVTYAYNLLAPSGLLLAEEFGRDTMTLATAHWFCDRLDLVSSAGLLTSASGAHSGAHSAPLRAKYEGIFDKTVPVLERWSRFHQHDPPLPERGTLVAEVSKVFGGEKTSVLEVPFLYHYFVNFGLQDTPIGVQTLATIMSQELRSLKEGPIIHIGFHIIAEKQ